MYHGIFVREVSCGRLFYFVLFLLTFHEYWELKICECLSVAKAFVLIFSFAIFWQNRSTNILVNFNWTLLASICGEKNWVLMSQFYLEMVKHVINRVTSQIYFIEVPVNFEQLVKFSSSIWGQCFNKLIRFLSEI